MELYFGGDIGKSSTNEGDWSNILQVLPENIAPIRVIGAIFASNTEKDSANESK
ncbi:hypothetical protein HHO41_13955 [Bacillus sp. DNRA2]|uniref:hypothetical protein n=1 Tax=Bacillus sp. DNRA2 TaxID=2723053 RepID=UPI00145DFF62|nr:hypothetical protein [Bacillus sp. DNRA2]NMD71405.1 hypothetical protein [Bacillus sp. DNRA2]